MANTQCLRISSNGAVRPTRAQARVLTFIEGYRQVHSKSPTLQETADALGYAGKTSVLGVLHGLEERGLIARQAFVDRGIWPTQPIAIPRSPTGQPLYFVPIENCPKRRKRAS